jgi:hypothetical protein
LIKYEPSKLIKKIAPEKKVKRLMSGNLTLKKAALSFIDPLAEEFGLSKKRIAEVALKTLKGYRNRVKSDSATKGELKADPAQLIQRVQNEVVLQIGAEIKTKFEGERYIWLPSDAEEPDPEHQLNYGREFIVGDGEMPGDRYGCRCGMQIKVPETQLNLGE